MTRKLLTALGLVAFAGACAAPAYNHGPTATAGSFAYQGGHRAYAGNLRYAGSPRTVRRGPPQCGDEGHFDRRFGRCVADEITPADMSPAHKAYLADCPGEIQRKTILRNGRVVEYQRCVR